jgi:hypothetical protein
MAENLLRDTWADLDQADLRLLLKERIGGLGQRDVKSNVLHLPLAREKCRVSLTYKGSKIAAIEPGKAFDPSEWDDICKEIERSVLVGPQKVGRDLSFSTFRVEGWWHGAQSGVQILPPPNNAPLARDLADNPFILEFPIQEAPGLQSITNHRRRREHRKLTLLLNLLLAGTTKFLPDRRRHFWACVQSESKLEFKWVFEWYAADLGEIILSELSRLTGEQIAELEPDRYYKEVGHDGHGLRVPSDLDEMICRYQKLSPTLQEKFDRATYWLSIASRQWEDSMA